MTSSIGGAGSCQSTSGMQACSGTQRSAQKNDPSQLIDGLFAKIDTKNQGYIDKSELQSAFASVKATDATGSDGDAASLFSKLDGDGDGKVTKNELSDGLQALASQLMSQLHQSGHRPPPAGANGHDRVTRKEPVDSAKSQSDTQSLASAVAGTSASSATNASGGSGTATSTADQQQLDGQTLAQWLKLLQVYANNAQAQNPLTDATSLSVSA